MVVVARVAVVGGLMRRLPRDLSCEISSASIGLVRVKLCQCFLRQHRTLYGNRVVIRVGFRILDFGETLIHL